MYKQSSKHFKEYRYYVTSDFILFQQEYKL